MANPFYQPVGNQAGKAIQGLTGTVLGAGALLEQKRQKEQMAMKEQEAKEEFNQTFSELYNAYNNDDRETIARISASHPAIGKAIGDQYKFKNEETKKNFEDAGFSIINNPTPENIEKQLRSRSELVTSLGGDPRETDMFIEAAKENPEKIVEGMHDYLMFSSGDRYGKYLDLKNKREKQTKYTQGTGELSGYAFNPETGEYSIDPKIKSTLEERAKSEKSEAESKSGVIDIKTRQGINKDFTSLIKDSVQINRAANDLSALKEGSSPTDQLAAIFKFMKSLDPTSVVREGEQQLAKSTGGPADAFVGYVNQIQGEGGLTPEAFSNMVNTAKSLSDSAVSATKKEASGWLDVYGDTMPKDLRSKLEGRIPEVFEKSKGSIGKDMTDEELLNKY